MQIVFHISSLSAACSKLLLLSVIIEWNKLDPEIQNALSLNIFKKNILKSIRPTANNIISFQNLNCIKYLTRLRLGG